MIHFQVFIRKLFARKINRRAFYIKNCIVPIVRYRYRRTQLFINMGKKLFMGRRLPTKGIETPPSEVVIFILKVGRY